MAFDDVEFPVVPLIHDQKRTVIDPVVVSSNGNYEYRVRRQKWDRFVWDIAAQTMTNSQKEQVRKFLQARNGGLNSFKYKDPELSTVNNMILEYSGGVGSEYWRLAFALDDNTPGYHPIYFVGMDLTATQNGNPVPVGNVYIPSDGIPYLQVPGTGPMDEVRITGTVYFVVRLDSSFADTLYALCADGTPRGHKVDSIRLIEVFGEY